MNLIPILVGGFGGKWWRRKNVNLTLNNIPRSLSSLCACLRERWSRWHGELRLERAGKGVRREKANRKKRGNERRVGYCFKLLK